MSPVVHLMDLDEVPYGLCSPVHAGGEQGTPRLVQSPRARIYSIPLDQVVDGVVVSVFGRDDDVVNLANGRTGMGRVRASGPAACEEERHCDARTVGSIWPRETIASSRTSFPARTASSSVRARKKSNPAPASVRNLARIWSVHPGIQLHEKPQAAR